MSAYVIAQLEVHDPEEFAKYIEGFNPVFKRHGGEVVGRSPETEVIEGEWSLPRTVIMRFPTVEDARRWHADPDYQAICGHRFRSSTANLALVEGAS
jgi:uncharacterized protein (DUF1330 family)